MRGGGEFITKGDAAEVREFVSDKPLSGDWTPVFEWFGKDPDAFQIVDDTVQERHTTWQQSKRLENGDRDTVTLHSWTYSAKFTRRSPDALPAYIVGQWRDRLLADIGTAAATVIAGEGTDVALIADPQLGKKRTDEAEDNWRRVVTAHAADLRKEVELGGGPEAIHVAFQGDEHENVVNNYPNQPHTVELNRSQQLELDYDLRVWTIRQYAALGLPLSASSVISNHGLWTRNNGKDVVTTEGDNSSTYIGRQVEKLFRELEPFGGPVIEWYIGVGDPAVTVKLSGVECYFSHGYVEKGRGTSTEVRTRAAIERQILGRTTELGKTALWFMAHYHHFYMNEFEGRTLFGCPALEAERSSEYMLNQYGVWSPPGMLTVRVSPHASRGWARLAVYS